MYILFKTILTLRYFGADPTDLRPRFCNDQCHCHQISQLPMLHCINDIIFYYVTLEKSLLIIVFIIQIAPLLSLLQHQLQYMQMDY
jgi:hypothetical protein